MKQLGVISFLAIAGVVALSCGNAFGSPLAHGVPKASEISKAARARKGASSNLQLVDWAVPKPHASLQCKVRTLEKMGWAIDHTPSARGATVHLANPCTYSSLEEARRAGDLKLTLPTRLQTDAQVQKVESIVDEALTGVGTQCLYSMNLSKAVQRATSKLSANHWYHFKLPIGVDLIRLGGNSNWKNLECEDGACVIPSGSPAAAIESLYTSWFSSECATGLQIAEYASIYELFGAREFDRRFHPEEIYIASWDTVAESTSVAEGKSGRKVHDLNGVHYTSHGHQMLIGASGYIGNTLGEAYVDFAADRGQNIIITKASPEAALALYRNGGLIHYNKVNETIWRLSRGVPKELLRLSLGTKWDVDTANARSEIRERLMKMRELLQDPVYRDIVAYVHAPGNLTLGQHIVRLLELNPRTPYDFKFYPEALHGEIFDRWLAMQLEECDSGR